MTDSFDVAVIGGGHNGLAAAAYLAKAGKRVIVLERLTTLGGAATSSMLFEGIDASVSQYAHLVHLLPKRIIDDLGLGIRFAPRRHASYSAMVGDPRGLLIDRDDPAETTAGFAAIGALTDAAAWRDFSADAAHLGSRLATTLCDPLPTRSQARALVADDRVWQTFIEQPIGLHIERSVQHELVRGLLGSAGHFGSFTPNIDPSLAANRAALHRALGGVEGGALPVGGMGALSGELARVALLAGASLTTNAEVTAVTPDGEVHVRVGDRERVIAARWILADVAPEVLAALLGDASPAEHARRRVDVATDSGALAGALTKVNLLLTRLPRMRDGIDPVAAFGGTMHVNQGWEQLQRAHDAAASGRAPEPLPLEVTCHTLADPTILGPELRKRGVHSLSIVTGDLPLAAGRALVDRDATQRAVLSSLESVLAEPLEPLLLADANGQPCVHTRTPADLLLELGTFSGGGRAWPFVEDDAERSTPAQRWGASTGYARVLLCGAAAHRGGSVDGIAGHNAAMAVLEADPAG